MLVRGGAGDVVGCRAVLASRGKVESGFVTNVVSFFYKVTWSSFKESPCEQK